MSNALGQCWIQAVWLPSSSWMIPAGFSRWEVAGSTEVCCGFSRGAMLKVLQDGSIYWTNFRFVHCTGIVTVTFVAWGLGLRLLSHPLIQAKLLYHSCRALSHCCWGYVAVDDVGGWPDLLYSSACLFFFYHGLLFVTLFWRTGIGIPAPRVSDPVRAVGGLVAVEQFWRVSDTVVLACVSRLNCTRVPCHRSRAQHFEARNSIASSIMS